DRLAAARRRLIAGEPSLQPAFHALIDSARAALDAPSVSVVQKRRVPPSGNRHDYMSLAPYWWPDSTKPNGLPFVRRDGVVNPESRVDHDGWRMYTMASRVEALALAHYLTDDARYATAAGRHLRAWFVDSATRMNPNLEYGQAVPGVTVGRGIGIIDTRHLPPLLDAIRLLDGTGALSLADRRTITAWCSDYLKWLRESTNGREERAAANNHGVFYDAQVASLALFVGDTATARRTIGESTRARLAAQIEATGRQPHELERTRPLHYSVFNLDAFTMLAEMGRHVNVDLWGYTAPSGGSLATALRFVAPFADASVRFPMPEVGDEDPGAFVAPLRRASIALGDPVFDAAIRHLPRQFSVTDRSVLEYASPSRTGLDSLADMAFARAAAQVERAANALDTAKGFPRSTNPDGSWNQKSYRDWTAGFFAGTLWYLFQNDGDPKWRALAEKWTAGMEPASRILSSHDVGFMVFDTFGHGYLLTGNPHYKEVVLEAARSLSTRFNPAVGATRSWNTGNQTDRRRDWKFAVIIDNMMNLELLFWSGTHGGDTTFRRMAESHALVSARAHVRADGSVAHVALFDPVSGALERTTTWQGFSDSSAWARGQGWAIHGFANAYARTRRPELLAAARTSADWFIAHMPADAVPYWDFRLPADAPHERDASAAAIAASGMYDLARWLPATESGKYRVAADRLLETLARDYMAPPNAAGAVLLHSVGGRPQNTELDVGLTYADYYFIEGLLRRKGTFLE
ncbi:MAG: alginate lyase family protein, partial [Gemmatimonadaceae bacterium]|nr:alginate lyase family protein [Gemmatimonadaceae bacterium]